MAEWYVDLQRNLGIKPTKQNNRFFQTWQRWEGGHTNNAARFNWLNTTMDAPGAVGEINSVGVKSFRSRRDGLNALAQTLMNGRYGDIVRGLRSGDPYSAGISAGLQTWVSGRPDGNPGYAAKVLGRSVAPSTAPVRRKLPHQQPMTAGLSAPPAPPDDIWAEIFKHDQKFLRILNMFEDRRARPTPAPADRRSRTAPGAAATSPTPGNGKSFIFPLDPHGTHETDGLGWGTRSAEDIMSRPGTAVKAPLGGSVVYWKPHGAQGGGSLLIRLSNGKQYWLGHIANGLKAGTRFKPGQVLAYISSDHAAPHLHIDDGE